METLSVLPDGRIALCKMVHGTEITLVFQAKECPETEQSNKPNHGRLCRTQRKIW